jgi:exosome complex component CSL4
MRAKVISTENRSVFLSTADKSLGVIYALCSRCGHVLHPENHGMKCAKCGNFERRKISPDYGKDVTHKEAGEQNES